MSTAVVLLIAVIPFLCAGFYHLGARVERENASRRADRALRAIEDHQSDRHSDRYDGWEPWEDVTWD